MKGIIDKAAESPADIRKMKLRDVRRVGLSSPSQELRGARHTALSDSLREVKHCSGQCAICNWGRNGVLRQAGSVSRNLGLSICTRRQIITRCNTHFTLQRCVADSVLATRHMRGAAARVVCRWPNTVSKKTERQLFRNGAGPSAHAGLAPRNALETLLNSAA